MKAAASSTTGPNPIKRIDPRAARLLKNKPVRPSIVAAFRAVQPKRQIAMAKLMVSTGNYTTVFARALLLCTPANQLVTGNKGKEEMRIPTDETTRIENDWKALEGDLREVQGRYNRNMLELVIIQGYVRRMLQNEKIKRFLQSRFTELFGGLEAVAVLKAF